MSTATLSRRFACICVQNVTGTIVPLQHVTQRLAAIRRPALQTPATIASRRAFTQSHTLRAAQTTADEKIEEITELYATAKDEFEIAAEETEKMTVYAEDDRGAAREALAALQTAYKQVVEGQDRHLGDEVQRRIGTRIRELERAVEAMEEQAQNQD